MSKRESANTRLEHILQRISNACLAVGRDPATVTLIGASKKQATQLIRDFNLAGLENLGENYLQEAIEKQTELSDLTINWHFIGAIQSNKTKAIAEHFDWVHGVDRLKIAQRFARQTPTSKELKILIQLNPDDEASKAGVPLTDASELADQIAQLQGIELQGFMMIPQARKLEDDQRKVFAIARELLDNTNQRYGLALSELSMGMSGDLEAAIYEGSTMVRIGTDLFGARQ